MRKKCSSDEDIFRALLSADWDSKNKKICSSLFRGAGNSVSRKLIKNLQKTIEIFFEEPHNPPKNSLLGVGEINIGLMQKIALNQSNPTVLTVEEDPTPKNPAHAEIPEKISRSLSKKIIKQLALHKVLREQNKKNFSK